jgi:hypothetical protein
VKTLDRASTCFSLFVLTGLAACGGGDAPPAGGAAEEGAGAEAEAPAAPAMGEMNSPFNEVDGSAAEGNLAFSLEGGEYTAVVRIETNRGPGDYPVRLHTGTCAAEGTLVRELTPVEGQEGGEGSSTSSIPASEMPAGEYAIRVYDAQAGNALACAEVPQM